MHSRILGAFVYSKIINNNMAMNNDLQINHSDRQMNHHYDHFV